MRCLCAIVGCHVTGGCARFLTLHSDECYMKIEACIKAVEDKITVLVEVYEAEMVARDSGKAAEKTADAGSGEETESEEEGGA